MKKIISLAFLLAVVLTTTAQKFAYIDSEYILKNIPEYQEAQKQLDGFSKQWQTEVEKKYEEIDKMYKDFKAEEILLTESMKNKRREEIIKR